MLGNHLPVINCIIRRRNLFMSQEPLQVRLEGIGTGDLEEEELFVLLRQTRPR